MITIQKYEAVGIGLSIGVLALALFLVRFNGLASPAAEFSGSSQAATVVAGSDPAAVGAALQGSMSASGRIERLVATDVRLGSGPEAERGDTVTMNYIATLQNGQEFDNSYKKGEAFTFKIGDGKVISGLSQGLIGMKAGGQRVIIIPADLAYGEEGYGPIPGGAAVVYAVELLEIQ